MYIDPEGLQPKTTKSRFLADELHGLIDALQHLHSQIASILANARIHTSRSPRGTRDRLNIADPLKEYIIRAAAEPQAPEREPVSPNAEASGSQKEMSLGATDYVEPSSPSHQQENALSQHLSKKAMDYEYHSDMSEKMRANTIEHIKKAIRLTRQGNVEGAKINAELADNAMNTAIEYMSEDEYIIFREEVMRRLEGLQGTE